MTMLRTPLVIALTVVAALSWSSADAEAKRRRQAPTVVQDAQALAATDRSRAIELLEAALAGRKADKDSELIALHAGEQRRLNGNPEEASAWFTQVLQQGPSGQWADAARLGQALVLAAQDTPSARVMSTLEAVPDKAALPTQNADRYAIRALDAARRGDASRVRAFKSKALDYARTDAEVLRRISAALADLDGAAPEDVAAEITIEPGAEPPGPVDKAMKAYMAGDFAAARKLAERASQKPDQAAAALSLLRTLDAPLDRNRIAVLLPLSDRFGAVGKTIRTAFEMGYGNAPNRLTFVDSGSSPETAVAALEKAVLTDGAIAVVGPLLTVETDAVVAAAERMAVPLISLSQSFENPEDGIWGFQAMYTRGDQVDAIIEWAMAYEEMSKFAVFAPDNPLGTSSAALFEKGVLARGGEITALGTYPAEEGSLLEYAAQLGERDGDDTTLAELREKARRDGGNPNTVVLPPVVDHHGMFIPERASRTPIATAALAYQEFPMGTFQPKNDQPEVPLLGLATWNVEGLIAQGNQYTRNSRFPDVFSAAILDDEDPVLVRFKEALGKTPTALEVATYDAARLVAAAVTKAPAHRGAFRQALLDVAVADAVTGASGFDPESQHARRNMKILTITRSEIAQLGDIALHGATPREFVRPGEEGANDQPE